MDINLDNLPAVIQTCFILHNFCETNNETVCQQMVDEAILYDAEFQRQRQPSVKVIANETAGKRIRKTYIKYLD